MYAHDWYGRTPPLGSRELSAAWSSVVVQERTEALDMPGRMGFYYNRFLEERGCDPDDYRRLNEAFVLNRPAEPGDLDIFFRTQDNPETHAMADVVEKCKSDPSLNDVVSTMISKMIGYAEATGDILDIAGIDNVVLYKEDGKWTYLLIDVIPINEEHVFAEGKQALHDLINGKKIGKTQRSCIKKTLNFTRAVNGIAQAVGANKRLEILSEEDKGSAEAVLQDWIKRR